MNPRSALVLCINEDYNRSPCRLRIWLFLNACKGKQNNTGKVFRSGEIKNVASLCLKQIHLRQIHLSFCNFIITTREKQGAGTRNSF